MHTNQQPSIDFIYDALCRTCDVLEILGVRYFIAGGTLLGAVRTGNLIPHDIDFDLDCFKEDEDRILASADMFARFDLRITRKMTMAAEDLWSGKRTSQPLYASCLNVEYRGVMVGDIHIFTVFDDGIARRFDLGTGTYTNAKMSIPAWFYSGNATLPIRNRFFKSVQDPELILEKIYGPDWKIPLKPGQFGKDRNSASGSVSDANIEKLLIHALKHGWTGKKGDAPRWPQEIKWVGWPTHVSRKWILRHEPLIHEPIRHTVDVLTSVAPTEQIHAKALMSVLAATAIQAGEESRQKLNLPAISIFTKFKRKLVCSVLPRAWRPSIRMLYKSIFKG